MKGEIAERYGDLIHDLWAESPSGSVAPREFKRAISQFAPQFSGYLQQDSQELLQFLLDGLHEDLNRIHKKPFIETKDHDGRPDGEVARETWTNHKLRNDSVIVDLFHSLLRSRVHCNECDKVSVTFDPYWILQTPLPVQNTREVIVNYVNSQTYQVIRLKVEVSKNGTVKDIRLAMARTLGLDPERVRDLRAEV